MIEQLAMILTPNLSKISHLCINFRINDIIYVRCSFLAKFWVRKKKFSI